jgi:cytochrome c oxidase subunit 2
MKTVHASTTAAFCLLAGCSGTQSALDVHGAPAVHLKTLMTGFFWVCGVVWLLVIIALAYALFRSRANDGGSPAAKNRATGVVIASAVGATAFIITGLTIGSFYTTRAIGGTDDEIGIIVKGEQWWWRVSYLNPDRSVAFDTANEIHIPVGQNIRLDLQSADVIHSFWVPSLAGKQDMVPGRDNSLFIRAERPGVYRGQCAEFCGLQHSHMAIIVVAEEQAAYQRWLSVQQANTMPVADAEVLAGERAFMTKPCAACHTVRGTSAQGSTGPDLTHVGSRQTIGAGLLEKTRGSLAAWIADPQTLKPGNNMPLVPLTSDELRQISRYMDSLK